jgi:hypothetical protein
MRHALALAALLLLSSCIIVDDFSGYWKQGKTDVCLNKIAESIHYYAFKRDLAEGDIVKLARGLTLDNAQFLMLKKEPRDNGGYLYRFRVENGVFMRYRLKPTMRDMFAKEYPDAPVRIRHDTVTIAALDAPAVAFLTRIAADERYWEKEDATLYNPLHNPLCIYEDRDLKTLEE